MRVFLDNPGYFGNPGPGEPDHLNTNTDNTKQKSVHINIFYTFYQVEI